MKHNRNYLLGKSLALLISLFAYALLITADVQASGRNAPAGVKAEADPVQAVSLSAAPILPFGAMTMDQSAFAMGTMQWNVIFVQNDGSVANPEYWTASERSTIQSKISKSKNYWEGLTSSLNPNCRLNINVNYVNGGNPISVPYEPSIDESENWINSTMSQVGAYNSFDRYTNVRNFNQDTRLSAGTNWSTTLFLIDNTTYHNTSYAYAYYGGPFSVLQNDSAGWGPSNFNMVLAHEMGHLFFANDEYAASGARTTDRGGYLNIANSNASLDGNGNPVTPPQPNALMLNNGNTLINIVGDGTYSPSTPSRQMFGLRDTDADSIPDILDTAPAASGSLTGSNLSAGLFKFNGTVAVTTYNNQDPLNVGFSNSLSDMTINTITSTYYALDGGAPVMLSAQDGAFDGYSESVALTLSGLAFGSHSVDIYGYNSVGNQTNTLHYSFNVVPEPSSVALLLSGGLALLVYGSRRMLSS